MPVQFVSPLWDIWRWSAGQARTMVRRVLRVDTSYTASGPCHKAPAAMNSNLQYALSAEHLQVEGGASADQLYNRARAAAAVAAAAT